MPVTQHPLHRSVRAELPHTAPALGRNDQTLVRIGMANVSTGQPMGNEPIHLLPAQSAFLTSAVQCAIPHAGHERPEAGKTRPVPRHAEVPHVSIYHGPQVLALFRDGLVHTSSQLLLDCQQLGAHALGAGQPQDRKPSLMCLPTAMRESKEVEGRRLAPITASAVLARETPELDQPRFALVQFQAEAGHPLGHLALETLSVTDVLEPCDPIIGIAHDDHIAFGMPRTPLLHPQVERVMEIDIGQQRADATACGQPTLR